MKKRILVIGAGVAQRDAILKAKNIGYEIYASDGSPDAPGLLDANGYKVIDVKDADGNLQWARELQIDGVISYASDITLPTVQSVRNAMQLPGLGYAPMEVSLDKSAQRKLFRENNISQPDFEVAKNIEEAQRAVSRIGYPCVIKPVDSAGSRGVAFLEKTGSINKCFEEAIKFSKKGFAIIEEFADGVELTVEGFSYKGTHHILAISDKYKPPQTPCVATQLAYPAAITPEQEKDIINLMVQAYNAAGVDNTPTHSEVILTSNGPKIVEIGCRGGGFYVFTHVVQAVSGYDIVGNWTRLCAGDKIEEISKLHRGVVLRFMVAQPGKLLSIKGLEEANASEKVMAGSFYKVGDIVPEFINDGTRTGWMVTEGDNRSSAMKKADWVSKTVIFETEPII